jgi:hypothetical protein
MWARVGKAMSSTSSSWHERVSQQVWLAGNDDYDNMEDEDFVVFPVDNASHRCPSAFYETCSTACDNNGDQSCSTGSIIIILLKILRWMKLIVLKLARSYYALPILLVALPLMMGLLVGFWCGRRYELQQQRQQQDSPKKKLPKNEWYSSIISFGFMLISFFASGRGTPPPLEVLRKHNTPRSENPAEAAASTATNTSTFTDKQQQQHHPETFPETRQELEEREDQVRTALRSDCESRCESGVDAQQVPRHVAVIMDGNRRYGQAVYGKATAGHWDGSRKVLEFAKWCMAEHVQVLTVYAFSTENGWSTNEHMPLLRQSR